MRTTTADLVSQSLFLYWILTDDVKLFKMKNVFSTFNNVWMRVVELVKNRCEASTRLENSVCISCASLKFMCAFEVLNLIECVTCTRLTFGHDSSTKEGLTYLRWHSASSTIVQAATPTIERVDLIVFSAIIYRAVSMIVQYRYMTRAL